MTAPPPRRPWWRRKRTWAAALLWLVLAYPASVGPHQYAVIRGWLPNGFAVDAFWPLLRAMDALPPLRYVVDRYTGLWVRLAFRHEGIPY